MKKIFLQILLSFMALTMPAIMYGQLKDLPGSDSFDAQKYVIRLSDFDFTNQTLSGITEMTCRSLVNNPSGIELDIINLVVDRVLVGVELADFNQTDSSVIITLPEGIAAGQDFEITTMYHGQPFHEDWGGVHWSGNYVYNLGVGLYSIPHNLARSWFPCIDKFSDKAAFEYYITVPEGCKGVCGGLLKDVTENDNGTFTYHWATELPLVAYNASFAVGPYELVEDTYHSNLQNRDIPITYYVRAVDTAKIAVMFQNIHRIAAFYEEKFGPYYFERIGYTGTSLGAMEHQNNISFPNSAFTNDLSSESLYAHELFHSWFGNLVTCASAEDMWINEGWASFAQIYYMEELYGRKKFVEELDNYRFNALMKAHTSSQDGDYYAINNIPQTNTYGVSAYDKGAMVVQALRDYLGDDVFFPAVAAMLAKNKYSFMTSYDLCRELSEASGVNLTSCFNNFVFQPGASAYVIDSCIVEPFGGGYFATVYVEQKLHHRTQYTEDNKVNIVFMDKNLNTEEYRMSFKDFKGSNTFALAFEPVAVYVDYFHRSYDAKFDGYKVLTKTGQTNFKNTNFKIYVDNVSDSIYCHTTHYLVAPNDDTLSGYRLSSVHHWKVDVINFGENNEAKGFFNYAMASNDSDLLDGTNYPLLMYRSKPTEKWHIVPTTQNGSYTVGDLIVDGLQSGEYAFAVEDSTHYGIRNFEAKISVYPNPSNYAFNISVEGEGTLMIFDMSGKLVDKISVSQDITRYSWTPSSKNSAVYQLVMLYTDGRRSTSKIIYTGNPE